MVNSVSGFLQMRNLNKTDITVKRNKSAEKYPPHQLSPPPLPFFFEIQWRMGCVSV